MDIVWPVCLSICGILTRGFCSWVIRTLCERYKNFYYPGSNPGQDIWCFYWIYFVYFSRSNSRSKPLVYVLNWYNLLFIVGVTQCHSYTYSLVFCGDFSMILNFDLIFCKVQGQLPKYKIGQNCTCSFFTWCKLIRPVSLIFTKQFDKRFGGSLQIGSRSEKQQISYRKIVYHGLFLYQCWFQPIQ